MSRAELIRALRALEESNDPESAHHEADTLLLRYIGDPEIEEAYDAIDKWYA